MLRHSSQTVSSDYLAALVKQEYLSLTPKGRLILRVLHHDYRIKGEEGLTRREIAEQLGQYRLYPHDDRAIKHLQETGFIFIEELMLGDLLPDEWDSFAPARRRNITKYTRFNVHWLNGAYCDALKRIFKSEGQAEQHEQSERDDHVDKDDSLWKKLTRIFVTK